MATSKNSKRATTTTTTGASDMGKNSKRKNNKNGTRTTAPADPTRKPRILVLEGLSASAAAVRRAGGDVTSIAPTSADKVAAALARTDWDGLLLTGGGDVNPRLYHRRPHAKVYGVSQTRDAVETHALAVARDRGVPVFGLCRGMQIQNVEAGGTMRQHIGGHSGTSHSVTPVRGSVFHAATGERDAVVVTSLHHQECGRIARGYRVVGRAPDGTVEAIESKDGRCIGVQFHPEMDQDDEYARDLFRWLVVESAHRAGLAVPARPVYVAPASSYWHGMGAARPAPVVQSTRVPTVTAPARREWAGWCPHDGIRFESSRDLVDHMGIVHNEWVDQDEKDAATAARDASWLTAAEWADLLAD